MILSFHSSSDHQETFLGAFKDEKKQYLPPLCEKWHSLKAIMNEVTKSI